MAKKGQSEYDKFDRALGELLKIPRSEVKAKLDAEKAAKTERRKPKKASA